LAILDWTGLDWIRLGWIRLDGSRLDGSRLDWIGAVRPFRTAVLGGPCGALLEITVITLSTPLVIALPAEIIPQVVLERLTDTTGPHDKDIWAETFECVGRKGWVC
jgi:hypothetical protein